MTIKTTVHINFRGQAREALTFYQSVFGGEVALVTYGDTGAAPSLEAASQIMWGQVASAAGFHVMAYDVPEGMDWAAGTIPYFVSVRGADADEIKRYWDKLVVDGVIVQPIGPSAWSPLYGMVKDQFGITWVLDIEVTYGS